MNDYLLFPIPIAILISIILEPILKLRFVEWSYTFGFKAFKQNEHWKEVSFSDIKNPNISSTCVFKVINEKTILFFYPKLATEVSTPLSFKGRIDILGNNVSIVGRLSLIPTLLMSLTFVVMISIGIFMLSQSHISTFLSLCFLLGNGLFIGWIARFSYNKERERFLDALYSLKTSLNIGPIEP